MRLRLAALSTLPVIISSSMRVISSMFFPAFVGAGGKKVRFGLTGEVGPLACSILTLLPSLRYAHARRHLAELAAAHGFEWLGARMGVVREDQRAAVPGLFVYLAALPDIGLGTD